MTSVSDVAYDVSTTTTGLRPQTCLFVICQSTCAKHKLLMTTQPPLQTLIEKALDIEEIEVDLYVCRKDLWKPPGGRGVFGGQVIGQALVAATKSVPSEFVVHSLHCYFLRPGDSSQPIVYRVTRNRDGKAFATRSVHATQSSKVIFMMVCSFQVAESGLDHQIPMPDAPTPESLKSEEQKLNEWAERPDVPEKARNWMKRRLAEPFPIDIIRTLPWRKVIQGKPLEPRQKIWIRAKGTLGDNAAFHQCVAAYLSDHVFLTTSLLPHGLSAVSRELTHMATIDHSMWFHAPFRADDWMLFEMESPRTSGGRGLVFGKLYSRDGRLVVSCSQEGLIRTRGKL
eukprot:Partr_v1_DN26230_c1_g4_i3_m48220 putative Acyl-CoA thioesterase